MSISISIRQSKPDDASPERSGSRSALMSVLFPSPHSPTTRRTRVRAAILEHITALGPPKNKKKINNIYNKAREREREVRERERERERE